MSGFEVAGIVLAVIPLVISAIEAYDRKIKGRRHTREELQLLRLELISEKKKFRNTINRLFGDAVDSNTFQRLFNDVSGKLWSNPRVAEHLRYRLQDDVDIFLEYVNMMKDSLDQLQNSFPVDIDKHTFSGSIKRITLVFKFKEYWSLVKTIERSNSKLEDLLTGSFASEPIRRGRQRYPDFEAASRAASNIYSAITHGLSKSCGNEHLISVSMRSIVAPVRSPISLSDDEKESVVKVLVQHDASLLSASLDLKAVVEADVKPWSENNNGPLILRNQPRDIGDLCKSLSEESRAGESCLGLLAASLPQLGGQRYAVHRPLKPFFTRQSRATTSTLSTLLAKKPKLKMSEPAKRQMAFRLAQGLIQLSETPWMQPRCGRDDITLLRTPAGVAADLPFITASSKALQVNGSHNLVRGLQRRHIIPNDLLFALGILLIEIWMERRIDHLHLAQELAKDGKKDDLADFLTACRLEDRIYSSAGSRYGDVVRRCIRCQFSRPEPDLSDPLFRKEVYDGVVAELEAGLEIANR